MKWTIHKAATEWGVSRETLTRGLKHNEVEVKPGRTYATKEIHHALAGDLKYERTRRERALADKIEAENAEASGDTVRMDAVNKIIGDVMLPIRQRIMSLPTIANLTNPTDPEFARQALQTFADGTWPLLREKVAAIRKKDK